MKSETIKAILSYVGGCKLPTPWAEFTLHGFIEAKAGRAHLVVTPGAWSDSRMLKTSCHPAVASRWGFIRARLIWGILTLACAVVTSPSTAAEPASDKSADSTIQVMAPLALTGPLSSTAKDYQIGAEAHFVSFNSRPGARGRTISLIVLDNSNVEMSQETLSKAFLDNPSVVAVFMPMQIISALELLNGQQISLVAPPGGAVEEHDPSLAPNSFHIKGSWDLEYQKIAEHLGVLNINKVAFVYDNILGSRESNSLPLITQMFLRNKISIKPIYLREGGAKIDVTLSEVRTYQPQAVILGLAGENILRFLEASKSQADRWPTYTTSQGNHKSVRQALKQNGASLNLTQVFPPFWDRSVPLVREYQDAMQKTGHREFSYHSLEGYIAARVLTNAVQTARAPVTRQSIIKALESSSKIDLGGFVLDFSPPKHRGASYVDLIMLKSDGQYIR